MQQDSLLRLHEGEVRPEWIDFNGHMNLAYYLLAFDQATDRFLHHIGLGEKYFRQENRSVFVLEAHVVYHREMRLGDRMRFTTQLLAHDAKRLQFIHHMYHAGEGFLAAANEIMAIHVDMASRRSAPMPAPAMAALAELQASHDLLPKPAEAGRQIRIR